MSTVFVCGLALPGVARFVVTDSVVKRFRFLPVKFSSRVVGSAFPPPVDLLTVYLVPGTCYRCASHVPQGCVSVPGGYIFFVCLAFNSFISRRVCSRNSCILRNISINSTYVYQVFPGELFSSSLKADQSPF